MSLATAPASELPEVTTVESPPVPPEAAPSEPAPRERWRFPRRRGAYLEGATGKSRLLGLDAARGLAVLGMIVAHIGVTSYGYTSVEGWLSLSHGRSSILFAVIGGFSLGILTGTRNVHTGEKLVRTRLRILTRSALLLVVAAILELFNTNIAIILGFYACWFALALPFIRWSAKKLFILSGIVAIVGPVLSISLPPLAERFGIHLAFINSGNAAVTNFLLTGTYPGIIWMAFIFLGLGLSRLDWSSVKNLWRLMAVGVLAAVIGYVGGHYATHVLAPDHASEWQFVSPDNAIHGPFDSPKYGSVGDGKNYTPEEELRAWFEQEYVNGVVTEEELRLAFGESSIPELTDGIVNGVPLTPGTPTPLSGGGSEPFKGFDSSNKIPEDVKNYTFNEADKWGKEVDPSFEGGSTVYWPSLLGSDPHTGGIPEVVGSAGVAMIMVSGMILLARRFRWVLSPLIVVGSMSLTIYTLHVLTASLFGWVHFSETNTLLMWNILGAIGFAAIWRFFFARGPLEHLLHVASVRATTTKD